MTFAKAVTGPAEQVGSMPSGTLMQMVDINLIQDGDRIRAVNPDQVKAIKASVAEVGLLNPITVYRCPITQGGAAAEGLGLVSGAHRLAACRDLGHTAIAATIVEMDDLRRTIAECDENLCGTQLSPAERAEFTYRRKLAYEQLYPETRHGGDRRSDQAANSATRSFADETAAATGKSARVVRRDAERGAKISPDVFAMVKGTKLATGTNLDQLKELEPAEQVQRVQADLEKLRQDAESVKNSKAARTGNASKTGGNLHNSLRRPYPTGDRPACFAWLVEGLAGFGSRDFKAWLTTMDRSCQDAVKKAHIYAPSAVAMVKLFERTTLPRQHGDSKTSETPCLGHALLAVGQVYVEYLQEASGAPHFTDVLADLSEEELADLRRLRSRIEEYEQKMSSACEPRRTILPRQQAG